MSGSDSGSDFGNLGVLIVSRFFESDHEGYCSGDECDLEIYHEYTIVRPENFFKSSELVNKYSILESINPKDAKQEWISSVKDIDNGESYCCDLSPMCQKYEIDRHEIKSELVRAFLVEYPSEEELEKNSIHSLFSDKVDLTTSPEPDIDNPLGVVAKFRIVGCDHKDEYVCEGAVCSAYDKTFTKNYDLQDFFKDYVPGKYDTETIIDVNSDEIFDHLKKTTIDLMYDEVFDEFTQDDIEDCNSAHACTMSDLAKTMNLAKHVETTTLVSAKIVSFT